MAEAAKAFDAIAPMNLTIPIAPLSSTSSKRSSPNPTVFPPSKRGPQHSLLSSSGKEPSPRVSVSLNMILSVIIVLCNCMQVHVGYKKPKSYELRHKSTFYTCSYPGSLPCIPDITLSRSAACCLRCSSESMTVFHRGIYYVSRRSARQIASL